jgi:hypothetical protein
VILIVASRADDGAGRLSMELPRGSSVILTPLDLSRPGWRVNGRETSDSIAVAGGRTLESRGITGVVCLLPRVFAKELGHIKAEDRAYVADEMTAFLVFWLSSLDCPKLNSPTPGCLSGPIWSRERWLLEAASAGLPVTTLRRSTRAAADAECSSERHVTVTVTGRSCLGHEDPQLRERARRLASAAGVDLLSVQFRTDDTVGGFAGADQFPDVSQPGVAEAIWDFFQDAGRA